MSRADEWNDDDWERRPRRRRWDEDFDDLPYYRPEHSGAVTGVAVVSFVLGALMLLFSLCFGFLFLLMLDAGPPPGGPIWLSGPEVMLILLLSFFLWGLGIITAGIGVVNRRSWGRVLTLILGAFSGLGGVLCVISAVATITQASNLGPGPRDGSIFFAMMGLVMGLLLVCFTIYAYIVLLNSRYAEEFH